MEKAVAPTRIPNTMAVIFTVSRALSKVILKENSRYNSDNTNAPMPPTAADSVGVATPPKIDPSTRTMRTRGGTMALMAVKIC